MSTVKTRNLSIIVRAFVFLAPSEPPPAPGAEKSSRKNLRLAQSGTEWHIVAHRGTWWHIVAHSVEVDHRFTA